MILPVFKIESMNFFKSKICDFIPLSNKEFFINTIIYDDEARDTFVNSKSSSQMCPSLSFGLPFMWKSLGCGGFINSCESEIWGFFLKLQFNDEIDKKKLN